MGRRSLQPQGQQSFKSLGSRLMSMRGSFLYGCLRLVKTIPNPNYTLGFRVQKPTSGRPRGVEFSHQETRRRQPRKKNLNLC